MRITLIEISAIFLIIGLFLIGATVKPPTVSNAIVVTFGDSITYGYGTSLGKDYSSLLAKDLGVQIINAGRIKDDTTTALARLDSDVLAMKPDIVIVFLGGNDFIDGVPVSTVESNLKQIIKRIQSTGAKVILVGISYQFISDYERAFERLANELKVAGYVPNVLSGIALRPDLMADNIHPNDRGHEIIEQRIRPVLEKVLKEL